MEEGSSMPLWGTVILLFLLWLNSVFYGFASALQNLNENEVEKKAQGGEKKSQRLLLLVNKPYLYVNAIPLIVTASGLFCGAFFVPWVMNLVKNYCQIQGFLMVFFVILVCSILIAGISILTFRRIGTFHPDKYAYLYVNIVYDIVHILYPLTFIITWIAKIGARILGVEFNQNQTDVTEEEIISIVDEAHEQGVIEENEAEMIQNIISFNETEAKDIMTHRMNVYAFDEEVLLQEMVDEMLEEGNSRYPVYKENIDNIVGIIHYKDALKFITKNPWAKFKPLKEIPGLIRTATLIPETRGIGDLFRVMQAKKLHMAVVVDEYGQTAGIVSLEDILEEIVGDILDEYDEDEITIRAQKDNTVVIDGLAYIEDVEDELDVEFGELDFETLNGYLTSLLGHIPTSKDLDKVIVANGYRFTIISLGNKTIGKVRAEKIKKETKGE